MCWLLGLGNNVLARSGFMCINCIETTLDEEEELHSRFLSGIATSGPSGAESQKKCHCCGNKCFLLFRVQLCDKHVFKSSEREEKKEKDEEAEDETEKTLGC